jgi:hypothetical protein
MLHPTLNKATLKKLEQLDKADLVIGFTTYNTNPRTAAKVAKQAIVGAKTYYPALRTVLINADAGLKTNTRNAILTVASKDVPAVASRYKGVLGKGGAVSAILHGALQLQAKIIVIIDNTTKNITPEWIPSLITLILNNQADLVKPRYYWPLPEGALSDLLFYPFTRAVWGVNLRHPAAGDYALSANLAQTVLAQDIWQTEVSRFGFDIWLSTFAITENWPVAQAALGNRQHFIRLTATRTVTIFKEMVGTMLRQLYLRQNIWPTVARIKSIPTLTEFVSPTELTTTPQKDCIDYIEALVLGWMEYRQLWKRIMLPENLAAVEYLASQPVDQFYFPPDLWAKIAYDFSVVYNKGERDPDAIAASLYPLYLGRLASFWSEVAGLTAIGRAGTVAAQAVEFEEHIPYLKYRWEKYLPWVDSGEVR